MTASAARSQAGRAGRSRRARVLATVAAGALAAAGAVAAASPAAGGTVSPGASTGVTENYLVLYKSQAVPADAAARITAAGGDVVAAYDAIGVVVARSDRANFAGAVAADNRVDGASATTSLGSRVEDDEAAAGDDGRSPGDLPNAPASDGDSLSALQWDMRQISAPQAHAVTGGSPAVRAGTIDTGLDFSHPDLAPNYSAADSVDCIGGVAKPLPPGNDRNGHGTHTAGTIAAAANGIGIVGVAPNVRLAGIKAGQDDGYFFPEAVVCGFMWAGDRHLDVVNNSYFVDPWLFHCRNDKAQHAAWKAVQRAVRYAMSQGVTVVASEGNESEDLSHPGVDVGSPNPGTPQTRDVTNACVVIPVEISGVIGVTANGNRQQTDDDPGPDYLKSFYSSYGVATADLVAPGGDSVFGRTPEAPNGRVLSTYSTHAATPCRPDRTVTDPNEPTAVYCYLQGTSMASPHVAGVAALVISRFGDLKNPQNGLMRPGAVQSLMQQTADDQPCPTALPAGYDTFTTSLGEPQRCQGGPGHTSWYGAGQVNALRAVTKDSGQATTTP